MKQAKLELEHYEEQGDVEAMISDCQGLKHIQQVAYSTYHACLTQICFNCMKVRTSMDIKDLIESLHKIDSNNSEKKE